MKILGYTIERVQNKVTAPMIEKQGQFTISLSVVTRRPKDIRDFVTALEKAESTTNPLRYLLYDLYNENLDYVPHLKALVELRINKILQRDLQFIKKSGKVDDEMTEWLKAPQFKSFLTEIVNTRFYGYSLFDFTAYAGQEWFDYDLINRKHVDPIRKLVLKYQYNPSGDSYIDDVYRKYVMPIGDERDLGLFKPAAPVCINIRNLTSDMMNYVELAGNNFTITKTKHNDPRLKNQIATAVKNIGSSGNINLPEGVADIDIQNMSSSQQNELFTSIHDLLNKELSKLFIGSTMGIEDGSSRSQAEVHERTMGGVFESDATFVLDVLNYEFIDKLPLFNKQAKGKFIFAESHTEEDMDELNKDAKLKSLGLNLTPEYLAEKYGIPIEAIKQTTELNDPDQNTQNE